MKKIMLLLLSFTLMSFSYGDSINKTEKSEILRQFKKFQITVEERNKSEILNYISFPAKMNFKSISKEAFLEHYNSDDWYYNLKYLNLLEVNEENPDVKFIYEKEITEPSNDTPYKFNLEIYTKFISKKNPDDADFYKLVSTKSEAFLVSVYEYDDEVSSGVYYIFQLKNGKLKLIEIVPQVEYSMK